ncbi:MAG: DUF1343 domain-containing protein [Chlorobiaceae bacterium]|jgi:uncharacterized protein YbbC (DUF1343 family)|nr:DUF1343 domain-containing protein [Chlorobiaceae bacterium]
MVVTGLDIFLSDISRFRHRSIGLIVNQTSVTRDFRYSWSVLSEMGVKIKRIFSPEHGLFATEQDQIAVSCQPELGCELVSLYGDASDTLLPDASFIDDLDLVLFDIQDVGSRYYTYVNTLALFMEAVSGRDVEIMVLDRPNPLGGELVEGPLLDPRYRSFVGIFPVPVRHGMTAGELAFFYREVKKLDCNLSVICMEGWKRHMLFPDTGLPWIAPSPNMPTFSTALVYPGMCLFEGLNVSEGRGSTTPFEIFGAPFIKPEEFGAFMGNLALEGVVFRPTWFKPTFHKFVGDVIGGLSIHVTDAAGFRPFAVGVALTAALHECYPRDMQFLHGVYEFNDTLPAFDLLAGSADLRVSIQNGVTSADLIASWRNDEIAFASLKEKFHRYDS